MKVTFTVKNDNPNTVWNQLKRKLGREPSSNEVKLEAYRIIAEARRFKQ